MFENQFFPTPEKIVKRMIEPFIKEYRAGGFNSWTENGVTQKTILDPSAGNGAILDVIKKTCQQHSVNFYSCEIDPELKHILQDKGYRVIADDFLEYTGDYYFDLILMNPPFAEGAEHLLKAWEILHEGDIVCLLNSETINNPYTKTRELLGKIIQDNGTTENLGPVFKDSDVKTDVDVTLVRLKKKAARRPLNFTFEKPGTTTPDHLNETTFQDQVLRNDIVGNMIIQGREIKKHFVDYLKVMDALRFFSKDILTSEYKNIHDILKNVSGSNTDQYNTFSQLINQGLWNIVFRKTNIEQYMTHNVRTNFAEFSKHHGFQEFTKENVKKLVVMLFENRTSILENAIQDVFDIFTKYHNENRCHIEGWKTNDYWKVNKKIILPYWMKYGDYCSADHLKQFGDRIQPNYQYSSEYGDIDKVLSYISGRPYFTGIYEALESHCSTLGNIRTGEKFDNTCESTFFKMKFWKKGTLHIEFKDDKLWQEFNLRACGGRKWLPEAEQKEYEQKMKASAPVHPESQQPKQKQIEAPIEERAEALVNEICEQLQLF